MRDTDDDWKQYGEFEPYYGVLSHERFKRANLTNESLNEFWDSGRYDVNRIWSVSTRMFGERQAQSALDFGCGVGRLVHGMADIATHVTGVDISPAMVREASEHAPPNATFTTTLPDAKFDWINSYIVFQHISPDRGYALFQDLLDRAADSCLVSVQFTFFKDSTGLADHGLPSIRYATWDGDVIRPILIKPTGFRMMMYDYDLTRLFGLLTAYRFYSVHLEHTDHGGVHGATIYAAR